jgi:hypothetical protein
MSRYAMRIERCTGVSVATYLVDDPVRCFDGRGLGKIDVDGDARGDNRRKQCRDRNR